MREAGQGGGRRHEVVGLPPKMTDVAPGLHLQVYRTGAAHAFGAKHHLLTNQPIRLHHRELDGLLIACKLDGELDGLHGTAVGVQPGGMAPSSVSMWRLETDDGRLSQPVVWDQILRVRHIQSSLLLAVSSAKEDGADGGKGGAGEEGKHTCALVAGNRTDDSTLFILKPQYTKQGHVSRRRATC